MDWASVARLLAERCGPAVVLDAALRVRFVNGQAEQLLGASGRDVEGVALDEAWGAPSLGPLLRGVLLGARVAGERVVIAARGARVELALAASRVAMAATSGARGPALVVTVSAAHAQGSREPSPHAIEYEVSGDVTSFGGLVRLRNAGGASAYWGPDRPRCYREIYQRESPCDDCPVVGCRAGWPSSTVRLPARPGEPYRIVRVEARPSAVAVRVRPLEEAAVSAIRELLIRDLGVTSSLTEAERTLLTLLLDGRTHTEIAAALGTSVGVVRRRQSAIVGRLAVGRRAELLRLLL